jgi:hypothetical protein
MKKWLLPLFVVIASNAFSQEWPVKKMVMDKKAIRVPFANIPAFTFITDGTLPQRGTYGQLRLNKSFTSELLQQQPEAILVIVPLSNSKSITCELVRFSLGNIKFTENNTGIIENVKVPVTYRGIVTGETNRNNVTLTVNEEYLSLVATFNDKVIQVTQADGQDKSLYRVYNSTKLQFPLAPFECGTKEDPAVRTVNGIDITGLQIQPTAVQDKCVNVFIDCFDSLYFNRSSNKQQTINFVFELFNSVTTGYYNEQVNIQITTINVWTTADPFRGDNRTNALADLAANWKDNFFGNICVGLDFSTVTNGRSGLASSIGRVKSVSTNTCPAYTVADNPFCYNDLNYTVNVRNFPVGPNTTGQQVYLVMHEMGHLLGANHTKWCGWKLTSNPDTFGAIDSCGTVEGGCAQGPPPPASGATIMSYCVTGPAPSDFVSFNNGFGTLPGNAIRNFVDQSVCILNCSDCFGLLMLNKGGNNNEAFNTSNQATFKKNKPGTQPSHGNGQTKNQPPSLNSFLFPKN